MAHQKGNVNHQERFNGRRSFPLFASAARFICSLFTKKGKGMLNVPFIELSHPN
jgi:hypothetical protein